MNTLFAIGLVLLLNIVEPSAGFSVIPTKFIRPSLSTKTPPSYIQNNPLPHFNSPLSRLHVDKFVVYTPDPPCYILLYGLKTFSIVFVLYHIIY